MHPLAIKDPCSYRIDIRRCWSATTITANVANTRDSGNSNNMKKRSSFKVWLLAAPLCLLLATTRVQGKAVPVQEGEELDSSLTDEGAVRVRREAMRSPLR